MKKKTQRTVSILVTLLMLLLLPVQAFAQEYDLSLGDITVTADSSGQYVSQVDEGIIDEPQTTETVIYQIGGATANTIEIEAEAGQTAKVTLRDVNIDSSGTIEAAVGTIGDGNVNIELDGNNILKSGNTHAGLEKNNAGTLTIGDESGAAGSLTASGGIAAAGIGGGGGGDGSNITITGGTVTASGGDYGAGIGGGYDGDGSNINIAGGTVTASGGNAGAGIGGGHRGDGSNINIAGGTVTASGGDYGAGIGGGGRGDGSNINIADGTVTASGGDYGAGIGGGNQGDGSNITISGGTVTASGDGGAGIGGGCMGDGNNIGISGGTVTASGDGGAGIGGGIFGDGSNIKISGGTVTASGSKYGAGIGGGKRGDGSDIMISGGTVTANGGEGGAGIGGGETFVNSPGGGGSNIEISGGTVTASGGLSGAGIGGGCHGIGSDVTVSGYAQVRAQGGEASQYDGVGAGIGNGGYCNYPLSDSFDGDEIEPDVSNLTTAGWVKYYAPGANMNTDEPIRVIIGKVPVYNSAYKIGDKVILNGREWIVAGIEGDVLELVSDDAFTEEQLKDLEALIKNLLTEAQLKKLVADKASGERVFLADEGVAKEYFGGEKGHIVIRADKSILG